MPKKQILYNSCMFTDEIEIDLKAGKGGDGKVSFFPGKKSGPSGGNGGDGGNLFIVADSNISNLNHLIGKNIISAEDGKMGDINQKTGADGKDLEIKLPIGTLLIDTQTAEEIELTFDNQKVLVCKGGKGGKGNAELKSPSNTTPKIAEKGSLGQKRHFKIILRMIADFGLIGLPNAGKSSLLNELTNASVKVSDYPFTTLEPNLGALNGKIIADIPGLIEGASKGKGLGINFLKHIEKVKLLLHCISSESENLAYDYKVIMQELEEFNLELIKKRQIILLTKSDLLSSKDLTKKVKLLKRFQKEVYPVSILDTESLNKLKNLLK